MHAVSQQALIEEVAKAAFVAWLILSARTGFLVDAAILGFAVLPSDASIRCHECEGVDRARFRIDADHRPGLGPGVRLCQAIDTDHNRAIAQLAHKTGAHVSDVRRMTIWGNHSATQYPDIHHAEVRGQSAAGLVDETWLTDEFIPLVQQRGAAIIKARGASSAASAASAAIDHMHDWALGTPGDDILADVVCGGIAVPNKGAFRPERIDVLRTEAGTTVLAIALREGHARRVRAAFGSVRCEVEHMTRTGLGPLSLGDLRVGAWRALNVNELESLSPPAAGSSRR
mgnify:CR=1 FL=1